MPGMGEPGMIQITFTEDNADIEWKAFHHRDILTRMDIFPYNV